MLSMCLSRGGRADINLWIIINIINYTVTRHSMVRKYSRGEQNFKNLRNSKLFYSPFLMYCVLIEPLCISCVLCSH